MHGHPIRPLTSQLLQQRMELAKTVPLSSTANPVVTLEYKSSSIIFEDELDSIVQIDTHGSIVADLDGDGHLDILVSNGGNMGLFGMDDRDDSFDNLLFWGTEDFFIGGRQTARDANLHMRKGRGRFMYIMDVNNDGLLDIFSIQDRRVSNDIVPGVLLINQGNRTWEPDLNMREYARAMIVTDANGDGYADDIVLNRSFCYPHRNGPDIDEDYPQLGEYTPENKQFCSIRPVGTTAIYKYDMQSKQMKDVGKTYSNFWAGPSRQPECCPQTSFDGSNDCNAVKIVSADFDQDQKADHIFLFKYKMQFYFSSERTNGAFPDNVNYIGKTITFPSYCSSAIDVQVVDLDNDSQEEILVTCENAGTFLIYTQILNEKRWTLKNGCNENDSLGSITNRFLAFSTHNDLAEICTEEFLLPGWLTLNSVCEQYKETDELPTPSTTGISLVDLNNDGLLDLVVAHSFGYLRFFYNVPPENTSDSGTTLSQTRNRYIRFDFSEDATYGIGTTLVLKSVDSTTGEVVKQFREVSSHQHGTGKSSTQDSRITFGLGLTLNPFKLLIRWPQTKPFVDEMDLSDWEFSEKVISLTRSRHETQYPSTSPPTAPQHAPSSLPSSSPQHTPSTLPSSAPQHTPSSLPSNTPQHTPSSLPSSVLQITPSSIPSSTPQDTPSPLPSRTPHFRPSSLPSDTPQYKSSSPTIASPQHTPSVLPTKASSNPSFDPIKKPKGDQKDLTTTSPSPIQALIVDAMEVKVPFASSNVHKWDANDLTKNKDGSLEAIQLLFSEAMTRMIDDINLDSTHEIVMIQSWVTNIIDIKCPESTKNEFNQRKAAPKCQSIDGIIKYRSASNNATATKNILESQSKYFIENGEMNQEVAGIQNDFVFYSLSNGGTSLHIPTIAGISSAGAVLGLIVLVTFVKKIRSRYDQVLFTNLSDEKFTSSPDYGQGLDSSQCQTSDCDHFPVNQNYVTLLHDESIEIQLSSSVV